MVGAAARNARPAFGIAPKLAMMPSQPRPMSSQTAVDRNAATEAVAAIRNGPDRSIGEPAATYHADRHKKPYAIDNGMAVADASRQLKTPCSASSAASNIPGGSHMVMYAARRPELARMGCMRG